MRFLRNSSIVTIPVLFPFFAAAQTFRKFTDVSAMVVGVLNLLFPVLVSLALLAFFWGIIKYIAKSDSEKGREEGKNVMIWGTVALFVMVSLWGIVAFLQVTFFNQVLSPTTGSPSTNVNSSFGGTSQ